MRQETTAWLAEARGLRLKWPDAPVVTCRQRLHALGYCLDQDGLRPLPRTLRRLRQRVRSFVIGAVPGRLKMARSMAATVGLFLP